ncbi:MAG: hypothetical protein ACSLFN_12420 [Candidatus Limnocylindrales bacterium]
MSYLRRAGRGRLLDGRLVTWSVAEGGRGRRWRWTVATGEGTLEHAGLIELDTLGRFVRLEFETAAGMLTFHPAGDGASAHGNVVRADRVEPISTAWIPGSGLQIVGDAFANTFLSPARAVLAIGSDLTIGSAGSRAANDALAVDDRGVPRLLDAAEWALEV